VLQALLQGQLTWAEEPRRGLSKVLLPLLRLGQLDEARELQERGYRYIRNASHFVTELAHQLRFVVLVGDMTQARRMVERHLAGALDSVMLDERFAYLLAARLWTERLLGQGTEALKVRLPAGMPGADAVGKTDVRHLGQWFADEAQMIARRFDARNGTDAYQRRFEELPQLLRLAVS